MLQKFVKVPVAGNVQLRILPMEPLQALFSLVADSHQFRILVEGTVLDHSPTTAHTHNTDFDFFIE